MERRRKEEERLRKGQEFNYSSRNETQSFRTSSIILNRGHAQQTEFN